MPFLMWALTGHTSWKKNLNQAGLLVGFIKVLGTSDGQAGRRDVESIS